MLGMADVTVMAAKAARRRSAAGVGAVRRRGRWESAFPVGTVRSFAVIVAPVAAEAMRSPIVKSQRDLYGLGPLSSRRAIAAAKRTGFHHERVGVNVERVRECYTVASGKQAKT